MNSDNGAIHLIRNTCYRTSKLIERSYSRFERFVAFSKHPLLILIIIGILLRIALIPFSFNADMRYWGWIIDIIDNDLGLYDTEGYYYSPVWGYVLGLFTYLGKLIGITDYGSLVTEFVPYMSETYTVFDYVMNIGFSFIVKLPLLIVDIIVGLLLHRFVKTVTESDIKAVMAFAMWFFCPLVLVETSVHGMFDNISALFLLLTIMLAYDRNYFSAGVAFSFSMMVKIFPICFTFLFMAWIFKKEGWDYNGLKKLAMSIAGTLVGFVILNIPSILSNNVWEIMRFFTDRLGVSVAKVNGILPLPRIIIALVVLLVIAAIIWFVFKDRIVAVRERIRDMDPKRRDMIVLRFTIAVTVLFMVLIAAYSVISISRNGGAGFKTYIESIAMKVMIMIAFISVALSFFIAYRFAFEKELTDRGLFTALMLTSCFLFIWMPLPQYPIAVIPLMVLFVVMTDERFVVPFIVFTVCMALYDLAMGGITALFSIATYTDIIDLDLVLSFLDFYTNDSFFLEPNVIFIGLFGVLAYISMIYLPFKWLKEHNWGRLE